MSQTWPDIPELAEIPVLARPMVWTRATMRAIRSPQTHLMAVACVVTCAGIVAAAGLWTMGVAAAFGGGFLGGAIGFYVVLRVLIEWQTRRFVPIVKKEVDWTSEFGDAIRAQDQLTAIIASGKHIDRHDR